MFNLNPHGPFNILFSQALGSILTQKYDADFIIFLGGPWTMGILCKNNKIRRLFIIILKLSYS
jgi:hypothetical protein